VVNGVATCVGSTGQPPRSCPRRTSTADRDATGRGVRLPVRRGGSIGEVWLYQPTRHKTAHRRKARVIPLGPRARAIIAAILVADRPPPEGFGGIDLGDDTARLVAADAYQEVGRDRDAASLRDPALCVRGGLRGRSRRSTIQSRGRASGAVPDDASGEEEQGSAVATRTPQDKPKRRPGERYTAKVYITAVGRACDNALIEESSIGPQT